MERLTSAPSNRERFNVEQKRGGHPRGDDSDDWDVAGAYLTSLRRLEHLYLRRRTAFKAREGGKATDRMFILSDDRPWASFARETRLQWRKWVFEACGTLQWPALHAASCAGDLEAVKKSLLARQKEMSACQTPLLQGMQCGLRRDASGRTALHHAVVCERWAVVKWLLKCPDAPLQLRAVDDSHRTPVHYALEKMEHIALRHPCRPVGSSISLATVAMRESCPRYRRLWRAVDRMLVRMNTLVMPGSIKQHQGVETVEQLELRCRGDLWDACRAGDVKRLEFLMRVYFNATSPSDADVVLAELRWTLLHEACNRSHATVVHFLLTHERMSCFRDSRLLLMQDTSGSTALHCASRRQALDVCALLVDECVDFGESNRDDFVSMGDALALTLDTCGRTALHWCLMAPAAISTDSGAECGSRAVVTKFLAQKCPAALHVRDCHGMTPLHLAVWCGDAELVHCFLDLGADADGACPLQLINRDEGESCAPTKAPWAPCGLLFQQRKRVESLMEREDRGDEEGQEISGSNTTSSDQQHTRSVSSPRQSSPHLFECPSITAYDDGDANTSAVYYWIRRMTARRCTATTPHASKMVRVAADLQSSCRSTLDGDETSQAPNVLIGCLKYGGSCDQCLLAPRDRNPSKRSAGYCMPLPPLILALRVCSRVAVSELSDRVTILELLLASGAQPDGSVSVDEDSTAGGSLMPFYSLLEALRTGHTSLVRMLMKHGATRLEMNCLERYCSTDWGVETLESLLSPLILLPDVIERSNTFIVPLFVRKCFSMLSEVIDSTLWTEKRSAWRVILCHLEAPRRWQHTPERDVLVDRDHLAFLSRTADYSIHLAHTVTSRLTEVGVTVKEEHTVSNNSDSTALTELIEFCVGICLRSRVRPRMCRSRESAADFDAEEATMMTCIRHLSSVRVGNVRLEQIIAGGFFQTATAVLETQFEFVQHQFSLDGIFRAFETGTRRLVHPGVGAEKHHIDDFLCVWLSKLLLQQVDPSVVTVTLRSVVYACAHNLPIRLVERCLELVVIPQLNADSQAAECLVKELKTIRVRGMRLEQWLVLHRRIDVIHAVFRNICKTSLGAWHFWRELVTATVTSHTMAKVSEDDTESYRKWTTEVLSMPSTLEVMVSTFDEFGFDTLEWLVLERIVPIDCKQMMDVMLPRILELNQQRMVPMLQEGNGTVLTSSSFADEEVASKHRQWFSQTRLIYLCARWNAMRVLTHVVEAVCSEIHENDAKQWLLETASRVDSVDGCSAIEITRQMGHLQIYHTLTAPSLELPSCGSEPSHDSTHAGNQDNGSCEDEDSDQATQTPWPNHNFGFLRALLATHERIASAASTSASVAPITSPPCQYFAAPSISDDLEILCRSNRDHHLAIVIDLLSFTTATASIDSQLLGCLVLTACTNGAINALIRLLNTFNPSSLTEVDSIACVQLVARQMTGQGGDVFVDILLLLLKHSFPPGRLAGDGGEITLLHRAACVHNPTFAQRIITRILAIEGCDINVLDTHGNTPVVYALASGRMENACFLMQHISCRLEAEYEGQACFYYALHLVPNPSARQIIKSLLSTKRAHAFLHCEADLGVCACKSFEVSAGGSELCNFCGHAKPFHTVLPLPSWFRDQYDTYIDGRLACRTGPEQDDSDDDDYNGHCQDNRYAHNESLDAVSDEDLENSRGRLGTNALARLALVRYEPIVREFGLQDAYPSLESSPSPSEVADAMSDRETPVFAWPMIDLHVLDVCESQADSSTDHCETADVDNDELERLIQLSGVDPTNRKLTAQLPWFIRTDGGMLHPPNCICQRLEFVTTPQMLLHLAVCRWLRLTVAKVSGHNWQSRHAFTSWRLATERADRVLQPPQPIASVESSPTDNTTDQRRARMLKRAVIAHWRLGLRTLTAFRAWKQRSMSPELVHHALEDAALDISADMRRNRLETLRVRQLQVQQAARAVTS